MIEEAGLWIARVLLHEDELMGDVAEVLRVMGDGGILGAKGLGHVEAIEPHLVGIALLVPEAAGGISRLLRELIVEKGGGGQIALVARDAVEEEKLAAEKDVVELMFLRLERGDGSVRGEKGIDRVLDVVEVARIGGVQPNRIHSFKEGAKLVVPGPWCARSGESAVGPAGNGGIGGAL